MTTVAWIVLVWVALAAIHVARGIASAFDTPPKPREDYGERDERERMIPMIGSDTVEYTQVIKRTEDGSMITALHLTSEAKRGLTVAPDPTAPGGTA